MQDKTKFNHIAIQVKDLEESGRFYKDVLKLKPISEPFKDGLHLWFEIGENLSLHLIKSKAPLILPGKDTHFCFSMTDLEAFTKRLDALDIFYGNWEGEDKKVTLRNDGIRQIFFQDPNGYWLEVNDDYR